MGTSSWQQLHSVLLWVEARARCPSDGRRPCPGPSPGAPTCRRFRRWTRSALPAPAGLPRVKAPASAGASWTTAALAWGTIPLRQSRRHRRRRGTSRGRMPRSLGGAGSRRSWSDGRGRPPTPKTGSRRRGRPARAPRRRRRRHRLRARRACWGSSRESRRLIRGPPAGERGSRSPGPRARARERLAPPRWRRSPPSRAAACEERGRRPSRICATTARRRRLLSSSGRPSPRRRGSWSRWRGS
mmetsp:Transcript_129442/g.414906  ORF Transcript_129442/g.414906 Transcript_129442/m.414906 type:complete len:243 (-) Transcript_129442:676-1404(-)